MIAKLEGRVDEVIGSSLILMVGKVGYDVELVGGNALEGDELHLYIYTHVREQELRLFGFFSRQELVLFKLLIQVSGIGPKSALGIMNQKSYSEIINSVITEQPDDLKVKGVGKKTAQRLVLELQSKITQLPMPDGASNKVSEVSEYGAVYEEAYQALLGLGFNDKEIKAIFKEMDPSQSGSIESIIKYALNNNITQR